MSSARRYASHGRIHNLYCNVMRNLQGMLSSLPSPTTLSLDPQRHGATLTLSPAACLTAIYTLYLNATINCSASATFEKLRNRVGTNNMYFPSISVSMSVHREWISAANKKRRRLPIRISTTGVPVRRDVLDCHENAISDSTEASRSTLIGCVVSAAVAGAGAGASFRTNDVGPAVEGAVPARCRGRRGNSPLVPGEAVEVSGSASRSSRLIPVVLSALTALSAVCAQSVLLLTPSLELLVQGPLLPLSSPTSIMPPSACSEQYNGDRVPANPNDGRSVQPL